MSHSDVERAAGGVVVRLVNGIREVLLIDDQYGKVSFPKGHVERLESWEDAAIREVEEETGIHARIIVPLGRVEYKIVRDGKPVRKQVRLFLMEAVDELEQPVPQLEELPGAYYVPWEQAEVIVQERGYENWSWLMGRAKSEYDWHSEGFETSWRSLGLETPFPTFVEAWEGVKPTFDAMHKAIRNELSVCVPEWTKRFTSGRFPEPADPSWPQTIPDEQLALLSALEHTNLRPDASVLAIERLALEATDHHLAAVCIHPQHVPIAQALLAGHSVKVCTVVGFPLGAVNTRTLQAETESVIGAGATEVDMVIPVGSMVEDDIWTVYQHIAAVTEEAHLTPGVKVKVILETHYLSFGQVIKACLVALAAGADFVKTSTGFAASGARLADVAAMVVTTGCLASVKAAGGIKSRLGALNLLRLGATRLGSSSSMHLLHE